IEGEKTSAFANNIRRSRTERTAAKAAARRVAPITVSSAPLAWLRRALDQSDVCFRAAANAPSAADMVRVAAVREAASRLRLLPESFAQFLGLDPCFRHQSKAD